jgi:hypothetical protein
MIAVGIFIGGERLELFDDEKISINSSIQNVSDISKIFTDFSQTFTVPASVKNNRIFKHWYENSLENQFNTNIKIDAYIELDSILFRTGKIQLESCSMIDGQPQNYSITFIGALVSLKDKFAGLLLKDLDSDYYDFNYTPTVVKDKVTTTTTSADIMFPLISSENYWSYGSGDHRVDISSSPIRFNELFPAIRLKAVFDMITRDSKWNIKFNGAFLTDARFTNAYLWLKNAERFQTFLLQPIDFTTKGNLEEAVGVTVNLTDNYFVKVNGGGTRITITPQAGFTSVPYTVYRYLNGERWDAYVSTLGGTSVINVRTDPDANKHSFYIETSESFQFVFKIEMVSGSTFSKSATMTSQSLSSFLSVRSYFPEIKIEEFFSGILKMFNLTCFSNDGINFTVEQLENYYDNGSTINITKYVKSDKIDLNRVKSFKKINFEYEKSESIVNTGFLASNGVEYGSLLYSTGNEGEEYSIKLPFENLNFNNLNDKLQVGYALKLDLSKYVPKPIILYDYNPTAVTTTANHYHFATALTGNGTAYTTYKAFGQEYSDFSLNFNSQQSTLTNEIITKSLYEQYYEQYFANIFNYKARIYKVNTLLPISILTSIKLNDTLIIRDRKFIINTMDVDLTTGETALELLTDFRL